MDSTKSHAEVTMLLAAANLPASEEEIVVLAKEYAGQRAATDALYAVPEARYTDPALRFRAEAFLTDWVS